MTFLFSIFRSTQTITYNITSRVVMRLEEKLEKILITDIDGTLAHRDVIPEQVAEACKRLRVSGWTLLVATGRILASALPHIHNIGASSPAIVYDGARIMDFQKGVSVWEKKMPNTLVKEVLILGWNYGVGIQVIGDEMVFCRPHDEAVIDYFSSLGVEVRPSLKDPQELDSIFRVIFHGDRALIRKLHDHMSAKLNGKASVTMAGDGFLDILPVHVSKGHALAELLGQRSSKNRIVVAAGDHMNDETLLRTAHVAFTMEDAPKELKEIADVILPPSEEGGFVKIVDYLEDKDFLNTILSSKALDDLQNHDVLTLKGGVEPWRRR